jgi:hypothetical protein
MLENKLTIIEEINKGCFQQAEDSVTMNVDPDHGLQLLKTKMAPGIKNIAPMTVRTGAAQQNVTE